MGNNTCKIDPTSSSMLFAYAYFDIYPSDNDDMIPEPFARRVKSIVKMAQGVQKLSITLLTKDDIQPDDIPGYLRVFSANVATTNIIKNVPDGALYDYVCVDDDRPVVEIGKFLPLAKKGIIVSSVALGLFKLPWEKCGSFGQLSLYQTPTYRTLR